MKIIAKLPPRYAEIIELVEQLSPGDVARDGSIYLGYYVDHDWYVTAQDAKDAQGRNLALTFNEAVQYAKDLKAHGHSDWVLPPGDTQDSGFNIIEKIYRHKRKGAFRDGFDERQFEETGDYWCLINDVDNPGVLEAMNFSDGNFCMMAPIHKGSLRCVRAVRRP